MAMLQWYLHAKPDGDAVRPELEAAVGRDLGHVDLARVAQRRLELHRRAAVARSVHLVGDAARLDDVPVAVARVARDRGLEARQHGAVAVARQPDRKAGRQPDRERPDQEPSHGLSVSFAAWRPRPPKRSPTRRARSRAPVRTAY